MMDGKREIEMDKARELAVRTLYDIHESGAYANVALAKALRGARLSDQDRRFATELVYGTVKAGDTLDWMLSRYLTHSLQKTQPLVREILRLGIYQLFFLDRVPASAVCNTAVEMTKRMGFPKLSGFVNGVLRTAVREPGRASYPSVRTNPARAIALRYQHPEWLVSHWLKLYGAEETTRLCDFDNASPPLSVRTNTLRMTRSELAKALRAEGIQVAESLWAPEGLLLEQHGALDGLKALSEGAFQVQDESSMLVGHILAPKAQEFIIDCCAAPGGKTTHIACLMQDTGHILACDIYDHKLARIEENAHRLGIKSIETRLLDARKIGELYEEMADRVLVDAPCSGLGVLRRKADARWRKKQKDLKELPFLQYEILESAARAVKKGGILVYSTCTIEPAENEAIVRRFLKEHENYTLEHTGTLLPASDATIRHREEDMIQLMPHIDQVDGFFIARMKRRA